MKKTIQNTEEKPEELLDSDLDQAAGGYTKVEWTYIKFEGTNVVKKPGQGPKGIIVMGDGEEV